MTKTSLNATAYSYVIAALVDGPRTRPELMEVSGVGGSLASRLIDALRARGVLYVSGWAPDARGYLTIKEYSLGRGQDVPCPRMSRQEIVRRYMARRRQAEKLLTVEDFKL